MPYVNLILTKHSASLTIGETRIGGGLRLQWEIALRGWDQRVELSNGKDLRDLPGQLALRAASAAAEVVSAEQPLAIGSIHFLEAQPASSDGVIRAMPDAYSVELSIPEDRLLTLLAAIERGNPPTQATIEVPEMGYGWAPDGSEKKWQLEDDKNWLAVQNISFEWPRPRDPEEETFVEPGTEPSSPTSRETVALQELSRQVAFFGPLIAALLAAIAVGTFVR